MINVNDRGEPTTCSGGGPIVVIPAELAEHWRGTRPPAGAVVPEGWRWGKSGGPVCDYDRACDPPTLTRTSYGGFGWVDVNGVPVLVLDAEIQTDFVADAEGGILVRNSVGKGAEGFEGIEWQEVGPASFDLKDGRLFMFDSASPGAADPEAIDADDGVGVIDLGKGRWKVSFGTNAKKIDFVRFRRA